MLMPFKRLTSTQVRSQCVVPCSPSISPSKYFIFRMGEKQRADQLVSMIKLQHHANMPV